MTSLTKLRNTYDILSNGFFENLSVVENLMKFFPDTDYFVAGGYYRDWEAGKIFKDIDVFINPAQPDAHDLPPEFIRYSIEDAQMLQIGGVQVNLILLDHPLTLEELLDRMDIGICQIGSTKLGEVMVTSRYLSDVENKQLSILRKPSTTGDYNHVARVRLKFADHEPIQSWKDEDFA